MKKLTVEDLLLLEYGDTVYFRGKSSFTTTFRYVGRMPSSERYLIFSCGENLKHLYIHENGTFNGDWFLGEFDDEFIIRIRIEELEKELQTLRNELS